MRISQDDSSWKARGILRRDFRHTHDEPEITKYKIKKNKKARKRIDHKHVWVLAEESSSYLQTRLYRNYWLDTFGYDPVVDPRPSYHIRFNCTLCDKKKYKQNLRYGYEYMKWRKKINRR